MAKQNEDAPKIVKFKHPKHGTTMHATEEVRDRVLNREVRRNLRLAEAAEPTEAELVESGAPAGNAGKDEWHAYRLAQGHTEEDLEGMGRDDLRDMA